MNSTICYVTAFLDIGRNDWKTFNRTFDNYIESFKPYINLFKNANSSDHSMIVFMDDRLVEQLCSLIPEGVPIRVVPINKEIMSKWPLWSKYETEANIMRSEKYKTLMKDRLGFPEHNNPSYTLINHSKVDFIAEATRLCNSPYFCWTDFGYFKIPDYKCTELLNINKLDTKRINYTLINPLTESDKDLMYTMLNAPERIGGFWFFGPKLAMLKYQALYHYIHSEFIKNNLADDDQHLALRCYFQEPDLFKLHMLGGWHKALKEFQLPDIKNRIFIGDSHILCFENIAKSFGDTILEYSGSSINGLINPTSSSGARNPILQHLSINRYKEIVLMFGKVDLEWVYPYKNAKGIDMTMNEWIEYTVCKYKIFIKVLSLFCKNVYILGLHPPSLDSSNMINRINSEHSVKVVCEQENYKKVNNIGTLRERTNNTILFNQKLEELPNYLYTPEVMYGANGLVQREMIVPGDHHLNREVAGKAWISCHKKLRILKRKKVAVLICGHLRAYCDTYKDNLKKFIKGTDCDIFVASHYTSDHSSYKINKFSKIYSDKDFKTLFEDLPVRNFHIDSDIKDEKEGNYCWKMWRKVNTAWKMCMEYSKTNNKQYDYVVRTRPDILVREFPDWDKLPLLNKNVIIGFGPGLGYPDDIFAIGGVNVMEHYCDINKVINHDLLPHKVVEYTLNVYPEYGRCLTSILRFNDRIEKFYAPIITDYGNGMFELGYEKSYIGIGTPFICK